MTVSQIGSASPAVAGFAAAALNDLVALSERTLWSVTAEELETDVTGLTRLRDAVDEAISRRVADVDARSLPRAAGDSSTTVWLSRRTGLSRREAAKVVRTATQLGADQSPTRDVWARGLLSSEKAAVIACSIARLPDSCGRDEVEAAEETMVDLAGRFDTDDLRRLGNRLLERIDPEGADEHLRKKLEEQEKRALHDTTLTMRPIGTGLTKGNFKIPDAQADMFRTVLEAFGSPRRRQHWPKVHDDGEHSTELTHPQRMGPAFLEMIEHFPRDSYPQAGGIEAAITVQIDLDQLRSGLGSALLSTGTEISVSEARRLACNARIVPAVLGGQSKILDLGLGKRLYDRYQRIALAKRDGGCCWKGCERPPSWTEAHHLRHWEDDGPTNLSNGALFCFFHHQLLHTGEWDAQLAADGVVEVIPPARIDPQRRPLRHDRHKRRSISPRC